MGLHASLGELALLAAAIAGAGLVTGLLAGLFGIGGGGVIVPVLYEVFRLLDVSDTVRMQLCLGTSLAIIIPTAIRSYIAHRKRGAALTEVVREWTVPAIIGVALGALLAAFAPGAVFKLSFAVIALAISIKLLFGRESWRLAERLPERPMMILYGLFIGFASALMGIGGGSVSNIILTLYGTPIHNAVATAAGLGVPIAVAGTIGFVIAGLPHQDLMPPFSIGYVSLLGFALMAPVSSYTAAFGARLAHALPARMLEIAFGLFLLAMAARFFASMG